MEYLGLNPSAGINNVLVPMQQYMQDLGRAIDDVGAELSVAFSSNLSIGGTNSNPNIPGNVSGKNKLSVTTTKTVSTNFANFWTPTSQYKPSGTPFKVKVETKAVVSAEVKATIPAYMFDVNASKTLETNIVTGEVTDKTNISVGKNVGKSSAGVGVYIEKKISPTTGTTTRTGVQATATSPTVSGSSLSIGVKLSVPAK